MAIAIDIKLNLPGFASGQASFGQLYVNWPKTRYTTGYREIYTPYVNYLGNDKDEHDMSFFLTLATMFQLSWNGRPLGTFDCYDVAFLVSFCS